MSARCLLLHASKPAPYAAQPSRLLCSFCLGWVFVASLYSILISALVRDIFRRSIGSVSALVRGTASVRTLVDLEAPNSPREKPPTIISSSNSSSLQRGHDRNSLVFTVNLCFAFAGLAQFVSLLVFHSRTAWDTGCGLFFPLYFFKYSCLTFLNSFHRGMGWNVFSVRTLSRHYHTYPRTPAQSCKTMGIMVSLGRSRNRSRYGCIALSSLSNSHVM